MQCEITILTNEACQMPIQVPRARANLMTGKDLNKVQNEVKKSKRENIDRCGQSLVSAI